MTMMNTASMRSAVILIVITGVTGAGRPGGIQLRYGFQQGKA
jgi:hypothetical protein